MPCTITEDERRYYDNLAAIDRRRKLILLTQTLLDIEATNNSLPIPQSMHQKSWYAVRHDIIGLPIPNSPAAVEEEDMGSDRAWLNAADTLLCDTLKANPEMIKFIDTPELKAWWKEHKAEDARIRRKQKE